MMILKKRTSHSGSRDFKWGNFNKVYYLNLIYIGFLIWYWKRTCRNSCKTNGWGFGSSLGYSSRSSHVNGNYSSCATGSQAKAELLRTRWRASQIFENGIGRTRSVETFQPRGSGWDVSCFVMILWWYLWCLRCQEKQVLCRFICRLLCFSREVLVTF